MSTLSHCL